MKHRKQFNDKLAEGPATPKNPVRDFKSLAF